MTDSGKQRPRRAFAADDAQPDGVDDTRSQAAPTARRGAPGDNNSPFARPGSPSADTAIPAPVLPRSDYEPASVSSGWDGLSDETTPVGRRSAPEETPHSDASTIPTAAHPASQGSQRSQSSPKPARAARGGRLAGVIQDNEWVTHHKGSLLKWVAGAVGAAILIAGGFFVFTRLGQTTDAASSPSNSASSATPIEVTEDSAVSLEDAALIQDGADWSVAKTTTDRSEIVNYAACLSADPSDINPVSTLQRLIGTTQEDKLALMHQVDAYANDEAAQQIYDARVAKLTTCAQVPALITGATQVEGLGDQVTQVTVALDEPTQYHTVLLVRTGRTLQLLDVTRTGSAVAADAAVQGLVRPLTTLCEAANGACPGTPAVTATAPPAADPVGWLIPSDVPRITPGHGVWQATTQASDVVLKGTGCEGIPLASEPGPTGRQQRTLIVSQDPNAPQNMGVDEVLFTFADAEAATSFAETLANNLASCPDRAATAAVTEMEAASGTGINETPVTARMFFITQQTSDDTTASYEVVVTTAGTKVTYLLATVTADYQFSGEQLAALAIRSGQRATQG